MYRQYEDPYKLEDQLKEAKAEYAQAVDAGVDIEDLIEMSENIAELEQRVNLAWADDEYDRNYEQDFDY